MIIALLAVILFFFFRSTGPVSEGPAEAEVPLKEPEPEFHEIVNFEPFMVELGDKESIQFLYARFSFPARDELLDREIRDKSIILRDSIYYYLRNQEAIFLRDNDNSDKIKNDLLSVVNQYLSSGSIKDVLIEEYLVK